MTKSAPKIQVFGSGCPSCRRLHERTVQAAKELGFDTEVEYVTDIQRLIELGVIQSPVLAVEGKPILAGFVPDIEDIKKAITSSRGEQQVATKEPGCSCGGEC
jgi:small redox-active disulfide protein 2